MAGATPAQMIDGNDQVVRSPGWDPTGHQFGQQQLSNVSSDSSTGVPYGATVNDPLLKASADAQTAASVPEVATGRYNGATVDRERMITKFVQLKAQAVTAGTPVDVYTPTSGKKFRILAYHISLSVAGSVLFEDGTGNEVLRTPLMAAGAGQASPRMDNGILSAAANTHLFIDVSASGNVSGWIGICEE